MVRTCGFLAGRPPGSSASAILAQSMIDEMIHDGFDMRGGDAVPRRPLFREIGETSSNFRTHSAETL